MTSLSIATRADRGHSSIQTTLFYLVANPDLMGILTVAPGIGEASPVNYDNITRTRLELGQ